MRKLLWDESGWEDYLYWQVNDKKILFRINDLIKDAQRNPFTGLGKPEPLKGNLAGCWSRRINEEHRLVYMVKEDCIYILQCRFHY
ncbi:Txe/YoeB family addiction module toxin [Sediminibacterium sp.]|jgi:toxin YoeB|uniref:Txe/YoeB family addiction module toxin n=1 Tax=Sediminibacterium sp. TaxID=1917865 RepID=UPI003F6FB90E